MYNNSTLVILVVVGLAIYLIYSHNQQKILNSESLAKMHNMNCKKCEHRDRMISFHQDQNPLARMDKIPGMMMSGNQIQPQPNITNVVVDREVDPYSDPIKKQDDYTMYDFLTYPQLRLPREVLQKYNEYYDKAGTYPPFGQTTQPLFDNPVLNGFLTKLTEENEPFHDNIPNTIPLFRMASSRNTNRYFYYIIDQRYFSKLELKIPLDHVKINGEKYHNADFYGLPELFDGDIIDCIPSYPGAKFKVFLYKTYHLP